MDKVIFDRFRSIVLEFSGIQLGPRKEALVSARVGKRMRSLGISDYELYLDRLHEDRSGWEIVQLLDAISTNVTHFFREAKHFEFLGRILREWAAGGQTRFRMWSAACSTGEEPYSIAMTALASMGAPGLDLRILATDISTKVLEHSIKGVYEKGKLDKVPMEFKTRHFEGCPGSGNSRFAVKPSLKNLIAFKRLNLVETPFPMKGPFDVIFCRNVMIYLEHSICRKLLAEIHRLLRPGGYLMVGHAESLTGLTGSFKSVQPAVYTNR